MIIDITKTDKINIGMSIVLYQNNSKSYIKSQCFNNAFKCLGNNIKGYKGNRAVIGYVLSTDGIRKVAVRHAWNIIDRVIIDVTMFADDESPISIFNYDYLPVRIMTTEEFLDAVEDNGGYPALPKTENELLVIEKLLKAGYEVLE